VNADDEGTTFYTPEAFLAYLAGRSKRIYAAVAKGYMPAAAHLGPVKKTKRGPSFEERFRNLRNARAAISK
jgi:hypothetical protein